MAFKYHLNVTLLLVLHSFPLPYKYLMNIKGDSLKRPLLQNTRQYNSFNETVITIWPCPFMMKVIEIQFMI